MRKVLGVALALMLVAAVGSAWAGEIEGKIQKVEPSDRMLVLEDGTQLWLAEGLSIETLKEGTTVKASYEERDGKNIVTTFEVKE
ncbi:MAG: DUF1344 domain-containing protein [Candidatus Rokubacteria bacterium]|nr:DUF1344 domain-containing protein [Candidatus Rokubacteria bacterium]